MSRYAAINIRRYGAIETRQAEEVSRSQVIDRVQEAQEPPAKLEKQNSKWHEMLMKAATAGQLDAVPE